GRGSVVSPAPPTLGLGATPGTTGGDLTSIPGRGSSGTIGGTGTLGGTGTFGGGFSPIAPAPGTNPVGAAITPPTTAFGSGAVPAIAGTGSGLSFSGPTVAAPAVTSAQNRFGTPDLRATAAASGGMQMAAASPDMDRAGNGSSRRATSRGFVSSRDAESMFPGSPLFSTRRSVGSYDDTRGPIFSHDFDVGRFDGDRNDW
ncbi:MAG: hypothetical protein AAGU11_14045, partial [Syntrophobacteraceae bacterium]